MMLNVQNGHYVIGPGEDLSGADLSGEDLTGADLTEADLSGAILTNVQINIEALATTTSDWLVFVSDFTGANISGSLENLQAIAGDTSLNDTVTLTISDIDQRTNADVVGLQAMTAATVVDSLEPNLESASIGTDGSSVTLVFDEDVSSSDIAANHFEISGDREIPLSSASVDGYTVTLNISDETPVLENENLTLSLVVESISDSSGNAASFSALDIVNNSTVLDINPIPSIVGRGKLIGTDQADLFSFLEFDSFKRWNADRIINFNPSHGDKIGISAEALSSLAGADEISFATARTSRELRSLSRQDVDLVYLKKRRSGFLVANGNGEEYGWGNRDEGGFMAVLRGGPSLTSDDIILLT